MTQQMNKEDCLLALTAKAKELNRLPKKADFSDYETARIKAYFGPWPRALEAAGLIESKTIEREAKKLQKRIQEKRKSTEALKKQKQ